MALRVVFVDSNSEGSWWLKDVYRFYCIPAACLPRGSRRALTRGPRESSFDRPRCGIPIRIACATTSANLVHGRRIGAACSGSGASGERVRRVGHAGGAGGRISEALLIDM